MTFDPRDPDTWPNLLTVSQVAAIYGRSTRGIERSVADGRMRPAPSHRRPRVWWRSAEVQRDVFGEVVTALRARAR